MSLRFYALAGGNQTGRQAGGAKFPFHELRHSCYAEKRKRPIVIDQKGRGPRMGCQKGKSKGKLKSSDYRCAKCGSVSDKKKNLCKGKKVGKD
jgi:hypothetical protein